MRGITDPIEESVLLYFFVRFRRIIDQDSFRKTLFANIKHLKIISVFHNSNLRTVFGKLNDY